MPGRVYSDSILPLYDTSKTLICKEVYIFFVKAIDIVGFLCYYEVVLKVLTTKGESYEQEAYTAKMDQHSPLLRYDIRLSWLLQRKQGAFPLGYLLRT